MDKLFIKDFKPGRRVESVFIVKKKELLKTKDNKPYLKLVLADKTGSVDCMVWDNADIYDPKLDNGMVVAVKGLISTYRDNLQLTADDVRQAGASEYSVEDVMRTVDDIEGIFARVTAYLSRVSDKWVAKIVASFLDDADFVERFKRSPGARSWHNAYIGGLMEHTWEVMYITDKVCDIYPLADRDVAITGAFLHDIGKIIELDPGTFEYTVEGGLIGHLPLGFEMLSKNINTIEGFPAPLATHLRHIILSHHGEYDQQSPVLPKTLESTIVYHADDLVSQANAVKEIITSQSAQAKDWSNYITIKSRQYFLRKPTGHTK